MTGMCRVYKKNNLILFFFIHPYKGHCVKGHVVAIFGIKSENGKKLFRVKDSNISREETIPVDRTTFQEEFEPVNRNFSRDTAYIASGYSIQLQKQPKA